MKSVFLTRRGVSLVLLSGLLVMGSGCKKQPAEQAAAPQQPALRQLRLHETTSKSEVTYKARSRASLR